MSLDVGRYSIRCVYTPYITKDPVLVVKIALRVTEDVMWLCIKHMQRAKFTLVQLPNDHQFPNWLYYFHAVIPYRRTYNIYCYINDIFHLTKFSLDLDLTIPQDIK